MDVFFARIVMPRSLSRSLLSMIRSVPDIASFARNVPDCFRRQSTSVVLPWSTCAMIAMLRTPDMGPAFGTRGRWRPLRGVEQDTRDAPAVEPVFPVPRGARRGVDRY